MTKPAYTLAALLGLSFTALAQAPKVNFTDHISPIFKNACTNCHNPDKKKAGLDLTTYQGAMAGGDSGAAIKPGNGDGSLLYEVTNHSKEPTMPPKGDKLSAADLKLIKDWITGFALETANSKPAVAQANKVESAVVSLTRPEGPVPMPGDLPMEPFVKARALGAVTTLAASPWAPLVAVGGQKQVFLYNTETLDPLGVLAFPEGYPQVLRFSKNAKLLLAGGGFGGKSGKVVLWDVTTGDRVGSVGNEADAVLAADLSADHQFVALGGSDKRVRIYQTKDNKPTGLLKKHTEWVTAIAYSPDGKYLGSGDRNGGVEIWESGPDPKPFNSLAGHKSGVTALAFMPGVLASGSEDGTIKLWNVKEGNETKSWNAHAGGVLWVDFTPDGRLVSCGRDKVAKVWDATGKAIAATEAFGDLATRAVLNSERVIATDWSGAIRVYALAGDKANKVGEISANPPGIGEQLAAAEKTFTETTAALPVLQKAVADAEAKVKAEIEAAEAKRKQDLAAAEARKVATQQQLDAAKSAPGVAEKAMNDLNGQFASAKDAVAKAQQLVEEKKKTGANEDRTKTEAEVAAATKKFDALTAEIAKRREARKKFNEGTPDFNKADQAVQAIKADLAKAGEAVASAKAKLNGAPAPAPGNPGELDAAKAALTEAQKKADALKQQFQQAQQAFSKAKSESPKQIAEAEKSLTTVSAEIAKLQAPAQPVAAPAPAPAPTAPAPNTKLADLQKKLDGLTAEIEKRRAERAKFGEGTAEYEKANAAVQAIKPDIAKAEEAVAAAQNAPAPTPAAAPAKPAPAVPQGEGQQALAKAKVELDSASTRLAAAKNGVERWKRAQLYQNVFNARQTVNEKQAKHDDLVATAKDAFRPVELTKQAIAAAEQTVASGPKTFTEKEAALAEVQKAADAAKAGLAAAEKAVADKKAETPDPKKIEAEIAELGKQVADITAEREKLKEERSKFSEGSAEYTAIQTKRDALKTKLTPLESAVEAAKAKLTAKPGAVTVSPEMIEAIKKAQLDLKLATDKVAPAGKAVADAKAAVADAQKQIPELKARVPQLEAEGKKTKAEAEQTAAKVAVELQTAKAELEKLRAQYDAVKNAAPKSVSTAPTVPTKS